MHKKNFTLLFPGLLLFFSACAFGRGTQEEIPIDETLTPGQVSDGTYRGEYETMVKVVCDVTVREGKITAIELKEHNCSPIGKKAEEITEEILQAQSLGVDTVSGATTSSAVILKSVELALKKGLPES